MITIETADQNEVRRFRIAQFNGRAMTARLDGSTVTGHVRSVVQTVSSVPPRWTITLIPAPPKVAQAVRARPTPSAHVFAKDHF